MREMFRPLGQELVGLNMIPSQYQDAVAGLCACCFFRHYSMINNPRNKLSKREFFAMQGDLNDLIVLLNDQNEQARVQTFMDNFAGVTEDDFDEDTNTCRCSIGANGGCRRNGRRAAEDDSPQLLLSEGSLPGAKNRSAHDSAPRRLEHTPGCPETANGCHPASAMLRTPTGSVRIDNVAVGELVATPRGFEPVVGKLHADANRPMDFYRFETTEGTSVAISRRHQLIVNGERTSPEAVVVGDVLSTENGPQRVSTVKVRRELGIYHITTPSGLYYVDGVLATTYVAFIPYPVWRVFSDGYLHLRYSLGMPLLPDGEGALPMFAHYAALDMLDLPEPLLQALWPLTVTLSVVAELANSLVHSAEQLACRMACRTECSASSVLLVPRLLS